MKSSIGKLFRFTGLAASVLVWMVILLSIFHNPWFVFTKHAFSDLGGPEAANSWIYNYGMIILGILGFLYSLTLIEDATNKIETVGGAFMFIAGIFLALIGLYPSGTSPHNWVSTLMQKRGNVKRFILLKRAQRVELLCVLSSMYVAEGCG